MMHLSEFDLSESLADNASQARRTNSVMYSSRLCLLLNAFGLMVQSSSTFQKAHIAGDTGVLMKRITTTGLFQRVRCHAHSE